VNLPRMDTRISKSPEETRQIGAELARSADNGLVVGLIGDLGAGKTQFVKGFSEALGVTDRVHSPTFTLVNEYRGARWPVHHLDLYRLETAEQIRGAGLEMYLPPRNGVAIIEWFDRLDTGWELPRLCVVKIRFVSEEEREITCEYSSPEKRFDTPKS
jgi:tRNA threonylcarbamoyladenosine biosynthesis protein TsaE